MKDMEKHKYHNCTSKVIILTGNIWELQVVMAIAIYESTTLKPNKRSQLAVKKGQNTITLCSFVKIITNLVLTPITTHF